ncbi:MAG: ribonucleoside triphosphate reductase [Desulfoplanes sp.]
MSATNVKHIIKRDGSIAEWDSSKVQSAIHKALKSQKINDILLAKRMTKKVEQLLEGDDCPHIEDVQDRVEQVLVQQNLPRVVKSYILYRDSRRRAREVEADFVRNTIDGYVQELDWRSKENSNVSHSFQGLILHTSGAVQARYALEAFPEHIKQAHRNGYFHIHDLSFGLAGYCAGWSLKDLLLEGFNAPGFCSSKAPKHLDSALMQMVNFLGTLQNEWAGAQAFNNIDTLLAPYIGIDNLSYEQVKQEMQKFIFNLNTTSRWGGQSPFTNFTMDLHCPKSMAHEPVVVGGAYHDSLTYKDFQEAQDLFNKAFLEVMLEGDSYGKIFSYPIPTYNVTPDFPWDSEVGTLVLKVTAKYGAPYFQNFINSDISPEDVRSMCCRLQMDLRELRKKTGGLFGSGDMTGSIGVVTLNLPKYAFLASNEDEFLELLSEYAEQAKDALELKRKTISSFLERGFYPFTQRYLKQGFKNHFSTIGLVGGHEACLNLIGKGIETPQGQELMQGVLHRLRELMTRFQEETGNLYNLEATPAEGTCYRLAKIDKAAYGDRIITSGGSDDPYYTNSTNLPVNATTNVFEALEHQNTLQPLYTGGTVFHCYLGESVDDLQALKKLILKAMTITKIPYISITPTFSVCQEHGYLSGEHFSCPQCGAECEVYTRVTGFYRPVTKFNKGKAAEYRDRVTYKIA